MKNQGNKQQQPNGKAPRSRHLPDRLGWILYGGIALGGAGLDLWSKQAVFEWLGPPESGNAYSVIPGFFRLVCRLNDGAAFSILRGQREILTGISMLAMAVILVLFLTGKFQHRIHQIASGCITAGIIGNLYDRMFNEGLVRDFLDFYIGSYAWPTFNIADSLLCIGVGLIILTSMLNPDHPPQK